MSARKVLLICKIEKYPCLCKQKNCCFKFFTVLDLIFHNKACKEARQLPQISICNTAYTVDSSDA